MSTHSILFHDEVRSVLENVLHNYFLELSKDFLGDSKTRSKKPR